MSDHAEICALRHLGFTEYEARAYASLLRAGPQSCYGVAKQSGIPRANSYAVVDRLLERGALTKIKAPRGARYQAVPVPDLMSRIAAEHEAHRRAAESLLLSLGGPPTTPPAWQLEGNDEVLAAIKSVILGASEQLVVALWPTEAGQLAPALFAAQTRGVEITTLCMAACDTECGGCVGRLYRCRAGPLRDRRPLSLLRTTGKRLLPISIKQRSPRCGHNVHSFQPSLQVTFFSRFFLDHSLPTRRRRFSISSQA